MCQYANEQMADMQNLPIALRHFLYAQPIGTLAYLHIIQL